MPQTATVRKPVVDWLTVAAIAAIAHSFNVAAHEGVHALTCLAVGSHLQEYSALYVSCDSPTVSQGKMVAGSAPLYNLLAGGLLWIILRSSRRRASEVQFFLWLFMLMNWFWGAGYLIFSGIANDLSGGKDNGNPGGRFFPESFAQVVDRKSVRQGEFIQYLVGQQPRASLQINRTLFEVKLAQRIRRIPSDGKK